MKPDLYPFLPIILAVAMSVCVALWTMIIGSPVGAWQLSVAIGFAIAVVAHLDGRSEILEIGVVTAITAAIAIHITYHVTPRIDFLFYQPHHPAGVVTDQTAVYNITQNCTAVSCGNMQVSATNDSTAIQNDPSPCKSFDMGGVVWQVPSKDGSDYIVADPTADTAAVDTNCTIVINGYVYTVENDVLLDSVGNVIWREE